MRPKLTEALSVETDWLCGTDRVGGQSSEGLPELFPSHAAHEFHRADVMLVQPLRELFEHWIQRISGDALDDELPPGNADRKRITVSDEQCGQAIRHPIYRHIEQRVTLGVDRVLVQRDR